MDETDIAALRQMAIGLTTYEANLIEDIIADDAHQIACTLRLKNLIRSLLHLIDTVPYRDAAGLRLGDAVPVIESIRGEIML